MIKRILPQYAEQQSYVEMFLDEARLAARLNHASIVQVFDIGEDSEGVFFSMEYIELCDTSQSDRNLAVITGVAGGLLVGAGVTYLILREGPEESESLLALRLGPQRTGVAFSGRF